MKYLLAICSLFCASSSAYGAWAGGGGKVHRDQLNPWFLENTPVVHYCIDINEAIFGLTAAQAATEVRAAFADWTDALTASQDNYYSEGELAPYGQVRVGTQRFELSACNESTDIRFQFGTLTEEQLGIFENPREFVAIAARTDYDKAKLKGKGFIYLAPMSGPLAPHHHDLEPNAWIIAENYAFKTILRHEIGHIFGIDHQPDTLMDERLPEMLVYKQFLARFDRASLAFFQSRYDIKRLFNLKTSWLVEGCGIHNPIWSHDVFGKTYSDTSCGRIELKNGDLKVLYSESEGQTPELIATATIRNSHSNTTPAVGVYLPEGQQVFTKIPDEAKAFGRLLGHERKVSLKQQGLMQVLTTGKVLPLQIQSGAGLANATAVYDNRFENDVFFLD